MFGTQRHAHGVAGQGAEVSNEIVPGHDRRAVDGVPLGALPTPDRVRCAVRPAVPRTAIGFLYVHRGTPVFGFHMWAEVLIDGRWREIDTVQDLQRAEATIDW